MYKDIDVYRQRQTGRHRIIMRPADKFAII